MSSGVTFIELTTWFVFAYFILLNGSYIALNLLSIFALQKDNEEKLLESLPQVFKGLEPGISMDLTHFHGHIWTLDFSPRFYRVFR